MCEKFRKGRVMGPERETAKGLISASQLMGGTADALEHPCARRCRDSLSPEQWRSTLHQLHRAAERAIRCSIQDPGHRGPTTGQRI